MAMSSVHLKNAGNLNLRFILHFKSKQNQLIRSFATNENLSSSSSSSSSNVHKNNSKNSTSNATKHYDIIIAGGGLVGTTLACAISKNKTLSSKKVLLLEGAPTFSGWKDGKQYSNRVSAINHGTINLMKEIGAWNTIVKHRYKPVKQMHVWDACSNALITFNHDNFKDDVAYIIENDLILHAVYEELKNVDNVEVKNLAKIENVLLPKDGVPKSMVELKDGGDKISCELLIGADGANSLVRRKMGIEQYTVNYNQMGLVATLELAEPDDDNTTAWQRFLPTGPVALLPLSENLSSLVWSTTPEHAKQLLAMSPEDFVDALNNAFIKEYPQDSIVKNSLMALESIIGYGSSSARQYPPKMKNVLDKSRACFPLGFGHASSYITEGAALIGDSAHRIHPLAGQGVNLGFGDIKCLTKTLSEAVYAGFKLGDKTHLLKYERERLMKNVPIMFGVHGLQNLYSTTFSPVVLLRSIGLKITDNLPPLKKIFMEKAMG